MATGIRLNKQQSIDYDDDDGENIRRFEIQIFNEYPQYIGDRIHCLTQVEDSHCRICHFDDFQLIRSHWNISLIWILRPKFK